MDQPKRGEWCFFESFLLLTPLCIGRGVHDDDELVDLCVDECEGLRPAFELSSGTSMRAKHLRSYTEASLKAHVMSHGGPDGLVPPWLDCNNLFPLLRDSEGLASVKKAKVSTAIPSMVFGEGQSKPCVVFCFVSPSLILTNISTSGLCAGNH